MGLSIPSVSGFHPSGVMTDGDIEALLLELPEWHTENPPLRSVSYVDEVQQRPSRHRGPLLGQVLGECVIDSDVRVADIRLFRQQPEGNHYPDDLRLCLYHEIAHVVFVRLSAEQQQNWYTLYGRTPVIWNEAGRSPEEHFCDTYARFLTIPRFVDSHFPQESQFMRREVFLQEGV